LHNFATISRQKTISPLIWKKLPIFHKNPWRFNRLGLLQRGPTASAANYGLFLADSKLDATCKPYRQDATAKIND
jgi:hypothetical protein